MMGTRNLDKPLDLVYSNVGAFFAQRGYVVVIPDYRLAPVASYPGPANDVRDALLWITSHPESLQGDSGAVSGDPQKIFMIGHSAGALLLSSVFLDPSITKGNPLPRTTGLVLCGGAYVLRNEPHVEQAADFYGGMDQLKASEPLGLLQNASRGAVQALPPVLLIESENEPPTVGAAGAEFKAAFEEKLGKPLTKIIGKGHNHISFIHALGSGQGEQWAEEAVTWMEKVSLGE